MRKLRPRARPDQRAVHGFVIVRLTQHWEGITGWGFLQGPQIPVQKPKMRLDLDCSLCKSLLLGEKLCLYLQLRTACQVPGGKSVSLVVHVNAALCERGLVDGPHWSVVVCSCEGSVSEMSAGRTSLGAECGVLGLGR